MYTYIHIVWYVDRVYYMHCVESLMFEPLRQRSTKPPLGIWRDAVRPRVLGTIQELAALLLITEYTGLLDGPEVTHADIDVPWLRGRRTVTETCQPRTPIASSAM